ncbi:MAG: hypothetical protein AAGA17_16420 [Actinomycetota bacterium]
MVRISAAIILSVIVAACGSGAMGDREVGIEDADALYAMFTDDIDESRRMMNLLAADTQPPPPGGGISPLRSAVQRASFAIDAEGRGGAHLLFARAATPDQKIRWLERAELLSRGAVRILADDDLWPSCVGEPDCFTVGETLSLG